MERLDMADVVREAHDLTAPIVAAAGLEFRLESPPAGTMATGDRRRVIQVILNLVANAANYNHSGRWVSLGCAVAADRVEISVEDDGPGIAPRDLPRLFRAFDRLGQQERTKVEGTGLGLALSKSLVESMGGEIGYAPGGNGGARFWFSICRADAPQGDSAKPDGKGLEQ
jgi:signal transduction histidine kinase